LRHALLSAIFIEVNVETTMSIDSVMSIFGKLSDPEAAFELANAISGEGSRAWSDRIENSDFPEMLETAEREGQPITITRSDSTDIFEQTRKECQAAGLSYVIHMGDAGADGYTDGISWHPGAAKELVYLVAGTHPTLKVSDVKAAAAAGIGAVNALVEAILAADHVGKIELAPDLLQQYREYAGYDGKSISQSR
jgi:hypothetical protein